MPLKERHRISKTTNKKLKKKSQTVSTNHHFRVLSEKEKENEELKKYTEKREESCHRQKTAIETETQLLLNGGYDVIGFYHPAR